MIQIRTMNDADCPIGLHVFTPLDESPQPSTSAKVCRLCGALQGDRHVNQCKQINDTRRITR